MNVRPAFRILVILVVAILAAAPVVAQQSDDPKSTHWGVSGNFMPNWQMLSVIQRFTDADLNLRGSEFSLGFIRGRDTGGDWGVSFVRKHINDTSSVVSSSVQCGGFPAAQYKCLPGGEWYDLQSGSLSGVEIHAFVPFVRINRVQVGVSVGGGPAVISGSAVKTTLRPSERVTGPTSIVMEQHQTVENVQFRQAFEDVGGPKFLPHARAEATVAILAARGVKLKMGAGLNLPGTYRIRLGVNYLF